MIGARVVFAEPGVDQGVVGRLVVDPQEEELSGLQVGLELKHSVTAGMGETLECFTWFHYTWLGSCKARYYGLVPGCGTDRSGSLALWSQAYTSELRDRKELSQC
jgi:hypothetical protein